MYYTMMFGKKTPVCCVEILISVTSLTWQGVTAGMSWESRQFLEKTIPPKNSRLEPEDHPEMKRNMKSSIHLHDFGFKGCSRLFKRV